MCLPKSSMFIWKYCNDVRRVQNLAHQISMKRLGGNNGFMRGVLYHTIHYLTCAYASRDFMLVTRAAQKIENISTKISNDFPKLRPNKKANPGWSQLNLPVKFGMKKKKKTRVLTPLHKKCTWCMTVQKHSRISRSRSPTTLIPCRSQASNPSAWNLREGLRADLVLGLNPPVMGKDLFGTL